MKFLRKLFWRNSPEAAPQGGNENTISEDIVIPNGGEPSLVAACNDEEMPSETPQVVFPNEEPMGAEPCNDADQPPESWEERKINLRKVRKPRKADRRKMDKKLKKSKKDIKKFLKDVARPKEDDVFIVDSADFVDDMNECDPYDIYYKRYVPAPRDAACACPVKVQSSCCGEDCPPKRQQSCCVEPGICDSIGFKNFLKEFRCKNDKLSRCGGLEAARCIYNNMDECSKKCYRLKGCIPPRCKPCCIPFVPITKAVRRPYCKPCGF